MRTTMGDEGQETAEFIDEAAYGRQPYHSSRVLSLFQRGVLIMFYHFTKVTKITMNNADNDQINWIVKC